MSVKSHISIEALERRIQLTALPAGFSESVIAANIGAPTAMDVLPDGRVLASSQEGDLRMIKNGALLPTPFIHLDVDSNGERGLLGVAHDSNFNIDQFIYLYHTVPASGSAAPHNEVTRYSADGDVAVPGSAVDILQLNDLSSATNHNGGGLHFGNDGMLYVSAGENANPANSQTVGNLLGKLLRLDVSAIQPGDPMNDVAKVVPADNPFVGVATGINQAIFALGFRNPFTFAIQPTTGTIFVDDVGQSTWEEIDQLIPGANYGWNKSEGFAPTIPPAGIGPGTYQDPLLAYNHNGGPAGGGIAIIGGAFYDPPAGASNPFPASYDNKYFYGDLSGNFIRVFDPAHTGSRANPDTSAAFATHVADTPVGLTLAPDGGLYYIARGNGGELLEISANSIAAPTLTTQPADQTVVKGHRATFTAAASGIGTLTYQWQRNSGPAGAFTNIRGATHSTFTLPHPRLSDSNAQFLVIVSDSGGSITSNTATLSVVTNTAPVPVITITDGLTNGNFDAGAPISFTLSATDQQDGVEPPSRFIYRVDEVIALASTRHGRLRRVMPRTPGKAAGSFTPAIKGSYTKSDVLYRITFTVIDAEGLRATVTQDIAPNVSTIAVQTNPLGLRVSIDGRRQVMPTTLNSIVGFSHLLSAPKTQRAAGVKYAFGSWSDDGLETHRVVAADSGAVFTAAYAVFSGR